VRAYSLSHWHPEPESAETLSQGRPKEAAECLGLLRPAQAARYLGLSPTMLYRYRQEADGPPFVQ
jgi:hypothetical protein